MASASSLWNNAGTWEERDCSKWAHARLTELLESASEAPNGASITAVTSVTGHTHLLHLRGKARLGMELTLNLKWKVTIADETVTGTIKIDEMNETDVDDFELGFVDINSKDKRTAEKHAKELRTPITDAIKLMMTEAKERAA
eukprot:m.260366 g.260366  ORF g.260366 m.260366 type:complete len:143 (-) comp39743_c0_seq1:24-452(-)